MVFFSLELSNQKADNKLMSNAIATKNLSKYYGKSKGIDKLNLTVEEGDIFGFIGPNGSGKSTTIRTLLGLIKKTAGKATVLGLDIDHQNRQILSQVGYMPADAIFYPTMTVQQVVKLSAKLHRQDCQAKADELYQLLDLDPHQKIDNLSTGNRKKVSLICAMQHQPRLLILDEPTSGLDPLIQQTFWQIIHQLHQQGVTVFISSHILSDIRRHCLQAAILRDGELIKTGKIDDLIKTSAKQITIHGITSRQELKAVLRGFKSSIKNLSANHDGVDFFYDGSMQLLIAGLNKLKFSDLTISEPNPEELFIHYYQTTTKTGGRK